MQELNYENGLRELKVASHLRDTLKWSNSFKNVKDSLVEMLLDFAEPEEIAKSKPSGEFLTWENLAKMKVHLESSNGNTENSSSCVWWLQEGFERY